MARYVLDVPTLLRLVDDDRDVVPEHRLVAPGHLRASALERLLEAVRNGDMTERDALDRHRRITELRMRLLDDRVSRRTAWDLALEHGWTLAQASYLAVCRLQADAVIAGEPDLASRAQGIVTVAPYEALFST
ncbi:MAG: hypothetical protein U0Q03_19430 [Acidimicrobiales bacterium]